MHSKFDGYRLADQWTSYGWNVFSIPDGHDYDQILGVLKTMEEWDPGDRRPMMVFGKTTKGILAGGGGREDSRRRRSNRRFSEPPFGFKMNSEYIVSLARTFEQRYGVQFAGYSVTAR